jgi:poly-gamma-glutamate capsule biosynthesis protein CapA/YwtB (metallophosphatase superfamily)
MGFNAERRWQTGIDAVSTPNYHSRGRGSHGFEFTLDLLARAGIAAIGRVGRLRLASRNRAGAGRRTFRIFAYTFDQSNGNYSDRDERIAMLDADRMTADVKSMLGRADVVSVSMHAGW